MTWLVNAFYTAVSLVLMAMAAVLVATGPLFLIRAGARTSPSSPR